MSDDIYTGDLRAKADERRGHPLPSPNVIILRSTLDRALADVRENIGPQSQAAFAIEAMIRACEG